MGLFILASLFNLIKLTRTTSVEIVTHDELANQPKVKPFRRMVQGVLGIVFAVGTGRTGAIKALQLAAIPITLVTITLGTYLLFRATILMVIRTLRHTGWAKKHLNGFLLGQLNFRVHNYTRMLTIVSLLFAMALGAITVGSGYHRQLPMMAEKIGTYTVAVHDKTAREQKLIDQLHIAHQATYTQKRQGKTVYYNASELAKRQLNCGRTAIPAT